MLQKRTGDILTLPPGVLVYRVTLSSYSFNYGIYLDTKFPGLKQHWEEQVKEKSLGDVIVYEKNHWKILGLVASEDAYEIPSASSEVRLGDTVKIASVNHRAFCKAFYQASLLVDGDEDLIITQGFSASSEEWKTIEKSVDIIYPYTRPWFLV